MIVSPVHAIRLGQGWVRMLCCWDDEPNGFYCQRPSCAYMHAGQVIRDNQLEGYNPDASHWRALFGIIPCCMDGMNSEGCWYHPLDTSTWHPPNFELAEQAQSDTHILATSHTTVPATKDELWPLLIEGKWVLQLKVLSRLIAGDVDRYLFGSGLALTLPEHMP